jgi:integrase
MHVSKQPSGRWRVSVKHLGARRTATASTKREAQQIGNQWEIELAGRARGVEVPTIDELCTARLSSASWAPTLEAEYRLAASRVPDRLRSMRADRVGVVDIERAYTLISQVYTASAARRVHELLRSVFAEAIRVGAITRSPMDHVNKPQRPQRQIRPPSRDEVARLLSQVDGVEHVALRLACTTGARRGELAGLRWTDIDDSGQLSIVRSLAYTPTVGVHERPTKTGTRGHRTITLDPATVAMLDTHRSEQAALADLERLPSPVWVLSDLAGAEPWRPDRLTHVFADARTAAGVEGVRLHDLRHFAATQMLSAGVPVRVVAHRLGHASTATTERIYAHWVPGDDVDAADIIALAVSG